MAAKQHIFIGVGSNLNGPLTQVERARSALADHPDFTLLACSPWYQSMPVGPQDQPDFINGVFHCSTTLSPHDALDALQAIESAQRRQRLQHWGPRTLDLDILLFGEQTINTERLTVPHPQLEVRNFVLKPLWDLAPELHLPDGRRIGDILHIIGLRGLAKLETDKQR